MYFVETKKGDASTGAGGSAAGSTGSVTTESIFEKRLEQQKRNRAKAANKAAKTKAKGKGSKAKPADTKRRAPGPEAEEAESREFKGTNSGPSGAGAVGGTVATGAYNLDSLPKSFLELECLDLAGKPIANERAVVRTSTGQLFELRTDAEGVVRLEGIESGLATVSFPDLKQDATDVAPPAPPPKPAGNSAAPKSSSSAPARKPAPKPDVIPKGSTIRPPKKSKFVADEEKEAAWFKKLEATTVEELQPGDVLLRKTYEPHKVKASQRPFGAELGSQCSVHALLYVGGGQVIEASGSQGKVVQSDLSAEGSFIVWRPKEQAAATSAVDVAKWLLGTGKLTYSLEHVVATAFHDISFGPRGKSRAEQVRNRQLPTEEMMCSEFVSFCFQGRKNCDIQLDAMRVLPMELEDYLNRNPSRFVFAGALRPQ